MNRDARDLLALYRCAAAHQPDAYLWLLAFHGWCHAIDDHVDENHPRDAVVDLCADAAVLFSSPFYRRHADALGPMIAVVAEKYRASLQATGTMADVLRLGGNDVVLAVAYLTGGRDLVSAVSPHLWRLVQRTQLDPEITPPPATIDTHPSPID